MRWRIKTWDGGRTFYVAVYGSSSDERYVHKDGTAHVSTLGPGQAVGTPRAEQGGWFTSRSAAENALNRYLGTPP